MKPEITTSFGKALEKEVSSLLGNLDKMTDMIEDNFSLL